MIWFCMQIWYNVRILNQTRVGVSLKKAGITYAFTSKKKWVLNTLNNLNPYLVIAFLKVRLRVLFVISPSADFVKQNTRHI